MEESLYGFEMREPDKRRRKGAKPMLNEVKMLWQKNHEILGMALSGMGQKEIAERVGMCKGSVSRTVNSELGQKKLAEMRKERDGDYIDVSKKIAELSEKAIKVYEEIFEAPGISYDLKKKTSDTVLMDLGGHRAPTKIESKSLSIEATMEEVEEFKRLGHKAAKEAGFLIDIPEGEINESEKITE